MQIEFFYFADCPSHEAALQRLQTIMHDVGIQTDIAITEVTTEEQAQRLRFPGSPTILINGNDIAPIDQHDQDAVYGLACRAYTLEDGRISPLPSVAMLQRALVAAQQAER